MFVRQPQTFDIPTANRFPPVGRETPSFGIIASLMARLAALLAAREASGMARAEVQAALRQQQARRHRSDLFAGFPGD